MANPLRVTKTYKYIERKEKEKKEIRYRDTSYLPFRYREIHKGIQRMDDIKCCTERITKGYCSKDVDNIDIWFLNIIPDMLQSLMDKKMGVPKEIYDNYENIENGI